MTVEFAIEPLEKIWAEGIELARMHWNETQAGIHDQPFNPSFDRYNSYAKAGCYVQFGARDNGKLVGYAGVYLVPSMHTQKMIATEDTMYILPEYRKSWHGLKFFKFVENEVKKRGAEEFNVTVPSTRNSDILCKRLGYKEVLTGFSKQLRTL